MNPPSLLLSLPSSLPPSFPSSLPSSLPSGVALNGVRRSGGRPRDELWSPLNIFTLRFLEDGKEEQMQQHHHHLHQLRHAMDVSVKRSHLCRPGKTLAV